MKPVFYIPTCFYVLFLGSLQEHCIKQPIRGGHSSALGTTDLSLPKLVIEYA